MDVSKFSNWIGAGLGWVLGGGPIGAIIGYAIGSMFKDSPIKELPPQNRDYRPKANQSKTQSGDFEISVLILSAVVIKSDGSVAEPELAFVRKHFIQVYGKERAENAFKLFKKIIANDKISTYKVSKQIKDNTTHAERLQLLHFLFGVAKADGIVVEEEIDSLEKIAGYFNINPHDFESIKVMFYTKKDTIDNAYTILEIEKGVTDIEIKKAYRKMVKKHHPDKLQHLGPEHLKGAEEKFRQIQQAYELIQKERGF